MDEALLPVDPGVRLPAGHSRLEDLARYVAAGRGAYIDTFDKQLLITLLYSWDKKARAAQLPPSGDWRTWLILAGRGFGKTRAGAEWVRALAGIHKNSRIALVGTTLAEARAVMVEGETGVMAISPPGARPKFESSNRRLIWPNGAQAFLYSASEPESLRGPQHHFAWVDEIGKWARGQEVWDNLAMGLRLGSRPQVVATTTPRAVPLVRKLAAQAGADGGGGRGNRRDAAGRAPISYDCRRCFPMDEEIQRLVIGVRADTGGFANDVAVMKDALQGGLGSGAASASRAIETALVSATKSGKSGFDDLKGVALKALDQIAAAAIRQGGAAIGGGLGGLAGGLLSAVLGLPGRAMGGPVSPGAAYLVGERGPELFVPTSAGSVAPIAQGGGGREVKVAITVAAPAGSAPQALARSGRQVARAVQRALDQAGG